MDRKEQLTKQRTRLRIVIASAVVILIALLVLLFWLMRKDPLTGTWQSGNTIFEFNGKGEGMWMQGDEMERFEYKIRRDGVTIKFRRGHLTDRSYRFVVMEGSLTLTDSTNQTIYFTKIK